MLLNDPLPPELHEPVLVAPVMVAEREAPLAFEQIGFGDDILTVAMLRMLRIIASVSGKQLPLLVEVRMRETVPVLISPGPGKYVAFKSEVLLKFPSPVV